MLLPPSSIRIIYNCLSVILLLQFATCEVQPVDVELKISKPHNVTWEVQKEKDVPKNLGFTHAFLASLSVIIISELGDKTFFIAAVMAMRNSRMPVFMGAIFALALMTVLSVSLGYAITVVPHNIVFYVSTFFFAVFGIKMLRDGYKMSPNEGQEEFEEVQADIIKRENEIDKTDIEGGTSRQRNKIIAFVLKIFLQAFTLTFLAEWGDRSQLTTIMLAAREDIYGVTLGSIIGHAICTALAVVGGRLIAQRISVKTVTLLGGVIFMIFAVSALVIGPDS